MPLNEQLERGRPWNGQTHGSRGGKCGRHLISLLLTPIREGALPRAWHAISHDKQLSVAQQTFPSRPAKKVPCVGACLRSGALSRGTKSELNFKSCY